MSERIYIKFDDSDFTDDPEYKRLVLDFANAKMALEAYLSEALRLTLRPDK